MRIRLIIVLVLIVSVFPAPERSSAQTDQAGRAAATAIQLSQYESQGYTGLLYDSLHLDAKVLIPADAIFGWYQNAFFPNRPGIITVTGVEIVSWTWEVTGVTYPETAEVAFTQPFANGDTVEDVVRLVEDNGSWYWFFGRSREFVNAQISQHAPEYPLIDNSIVASSRVMDNSAPWGLDGFSRANVVVEAIPELLPTTLNNHVLQTTEIIGHEQGMLPSFASGLTLTAYITPPETFISSGDVRTYTLRPGVTSLDAMRTIEVDSRASPHFVILREARDQTNDVTFMFVELFANDAVGNVPVLFWGNADGTHLFAASMRDYVSLRMLVMDLTQTGS